ncbi:MAG: hypothetical protein J6M65_04070 [Eubacterium sp.]|nr:hypothetical protein [Eubacterium sp.]
MKIQRSRIAEATVKQDSKYDAPVLVHHSTVYRELPDIYDDSIFHWKKNKKDG